MNLVNISKVYGASVKCARLIVTPPLIEFTGTVKHESNDGGDFKVDEVKFAYPSRPEV